jgi:hypothetical protein
VFRVQRLREVAAEGGGEGTTYLALTEQQLSEGAVSPRLAEFCCYYSNRMSYAEVARLVERMTGRRRCLLSGQSIQRLVISKAASVSERWAEEVVAGKEEEAPVPLVVQEEVDFYDAQADEVLLMADAIQVKRQKAKRGGPQQQQQQQQQQPVPKQEERVRVSTDVWLLERAQGDGSFEAITAGIGEEDGTEVVSAEERVRWCLRTEYGERLGRPEEPLPIVAIADGAKAIRSSLESIFGRSVPMILDWYHLKKKVGELMSMVAKDKQEKERHLEVLLGRLWRGQVQESVRYILMEVEARNEEKKEALVGYLEKHRGEIIDYERRSKRAGKTIGSGRVEKGVDQAIGARKKKKGMSWSEVGSKALGILKVVEMNQCWEELWFSEEKEEEEAAA